MENIDINSNTKQQTILIAAGGTGGHLFPAEALSIELIKRGYKILFATDKRGEVFFNKSSLKDNDNVNMQLLPSATLGRGILGKISALLKIALGVSKSIFLLKKHKVALAIGFGGYPSFPPIFATQLIKTPTIIHEQNAIIGKANATLATKAVAIALTVVNTKGTDKFKEKSISVGNPVRANILTKKQTPPLALDDDGKLKIFVMGGSQGAKIFGDVIPKALELLPENLKQRIELTMQVRTEQLGEVKTHLEKIGINATLQDFFTDVEAQISNCHLFIGRSGASSIADVTVIGRAAIFVPMQHKDQQQKLNADVVANTGGAWTMTEDSFIPKSLSDKILEFFEKPEILTKASIKSAKCGKADAAKLLADLVENNLK